MPTEEANGPDKMKRLLRTSYFSWEFLVLPVAAVLSIGCLVWAFTQAEGARTRQETRRINLDSVRRLEARINEFEHEFQARGKRFDTLERNQAKILDRLGEPEPPRNQ
jgi:hypothetical protein